MKRRDVIAGLGAGILTAGYGFPLAAATLPRVVIVGGGMAGAAAAKFLRLWSNKTIDVTLVEPNGTYTSNIMSNLALTGQVAMTSLAFTYSNLTKNYGVKVVKGTVVSVSAPVSGVRTVRVKSPTSTYSNLLAERVVLAPGIQFDTVPQTGAPAIAAPIIHAWQAGPQTTTLRNQILAMPASGGTFIMTIPKAPYRCPPGPYERACIVADYLQRNKPNSKVIVLDANAGIQAEAKNFGYAFNTLYPQIIDYRTSVTVDSVDATNHTVSVHDGSSAYSLYAHVLNVIPPHRAGSIVQTLALADSTGFAPVDVRSFESTMPGASGIHVIGDSSNGTGLPKAGHVGNQGARICAAAIINLFSGKAVEGSPTANSACFSPLSSTTASWLSAVYHYQATNPAPSLPTPPGKMVITDYVSNLSAPTEAEAPSSANFSQMNTWFKTVMGDTFA